MKIRNGTSIVASSQRVVNWWTTELMCDNTSEGRRLAIDLGQFIHCVSKSDIDVIHYNFDVQPFR